MDFSPVFYGEWRISCEGFIFLTKSANVTCTGPTEHDGPGMETGDDVFSEVDAEGMGTRDEGLSEVDAKGCASSLWLPT